MGSIIDHVKKYRFLLNELVKKGIKLRYRRSYLGVLWTLLEPLLTMIVLTIIFGPLLGYSDDKLFPVYVLSGRLLYNFFSLATKESTRSIRVNAAMIKKVYVPKYLYPLSYVLYNYVIFLISLIVLAVVSLILGLFPTVKLLLIFIPLINVFLLSLGVSLILSTIGVFFRDMEYLWNVALTLIMYTCAIFYKTDRFSDTSWIIWIFKLNPLYGCIDNFRAAIGLADTFYTHCFNWNFALYCFVFGILTIVIGGLLFRKCQDRFILHI